MDALWFWFAKFLVEVGIVIGLFVILTIILAVIEWRNKR